MTSTTGRSSERRDAFTLLELVMVMLIVCISMAVAAPSLRNFYRGSQNRHEALRILALTRWARSRSAADARVYGIRFDTTAGTYHLESTDGLTIDAVPHEFGRVFALPEGCEVQVNAAAGAVPNCFHFYPNGRTDGLRIFLRGPGPDEIEIYAPSPTEDFRLLGAEEREGR